MKPYYLFIATLNISAICLSGCDEGFTSLNYDCSVFEDSLNSEYILPYQGTPLGVVPHAAWTQQNSTNAAEIAQYYAVDIILEIGRPLIASREGVVERVIENFMDNDLAGGHENLIIIRHEDNTFSRYWHLMHEGAIVEAGDFVEQGQLIGYSGFTGNATGPHLHFDIVNSTCDPNSNIRNELRTCKTLPVSFNNTERHQCGLSYGVLYTEND